MGKIIYHRDIKDQVSILDKEFDYSYYMEWLIYCITNSRNKTEWILRNHWYGFQASDQFRNLLFNSVK